MSQHDSRDSSHHRTGPSGESQAVVGAFLMRYLEDHERGAVQPLSVYQAAFAGYEELIAREFAKLQGGGATRTEAGSAASGPRDTLPGPPGPPSSPTAPGSVDGDDEVDGYELLSVLGEGGMGTVYLARQREPIERHVALKVIKLGMDTREVVARFETERQALALMDHPHIATVYDAGQTRSGRPYFAMEYAAGLPLTGFCDEHHLSLEARLELMIEVCDAVQHAHQKGIIHRDLKPSNVLVRERRGTSAAASPAPMIATPMIIDFGIAKSTHRPLTDRTLETQVGQFIGTPAYMSPEQAQLGGLDIDTRTDIYSLGMILYELLVGALPVEPGAAADFDEYLRRVLEEEPARPSARLARLGERRDLVVGSRRTDARSLGRRLRGDLDWIVMKAIEKDRDRRYGSASELAADLRRHLVHEPVLAGPPSTAYRARKFCRRHRRALVVAAAMALLLAGSAHVAFSVSERGRVERSREALSEAEGAFSRLQELKGRVHDLDGTWKGLRDTHESWEPAWRRRDEIAAWRTAREAREDMNLSFGQAMRMYNQVRRVALPDSPELHRARAGLKSLYLMQLEDLLRGEEARLDAEFFERQILDIDAEFHREWFSGTSRLELVTEPPGAEVFCFRYDFVESEGRLLPRPFQPHLATAANPAAGFVAEPFLEIESIVTRASDQGGEVAPFRPGDRLVEVGGEAVHTRSDLVARCRGLAPGESVHVRFRREGTAGEGTWVPFRTESEKSWHEIGGRFGLRFAGYPLEMAASSRLGTTPGDSTLTVELPRGSYLLVLRRSGFRDTRVPVRIPLPRRQRGEPLRVRLLRESEIPPHFVYIPAGLFAFGGDTQEADQSLEAGDAHLDGYLMSRLEVTLKDYLEFLNAPENLRRIGGDGKAAALVDWDRIIVDGQSLASMLGASDKRLDLIPRQHVTPLLEKSVREDGASGEPRWRPKEKGLKPGWPVLGISVLAGLEYAHWLSAQSGGRWRFRLPTDLEWEKAARGVDRRVFVWGDYGIFSFSKTLPGTRRGAGAPPNTPAPVGTHPADESVWGVRDLAGSAEEPVLGRVSSGLVSYRGGDWYYLEESRVRIANRNGYPPHKSWISAGLRLVAELE